ncbi:MAG: hypothetical protein ACTSYO_05810 [Candidatus Ranarchaeia archaeon]
MWNAYVRYVTAGKQLLASFQKKGKIRKTEQKFEIDDKDAKELREKGKQIIFELLDAAVAEGVLRTIDDKIQAVQEKMPGIAMGIVNALIKEGKIPRPQEGILYTQEELPQVIKQLNTELSKEIELEGLSFSTMPFGSNTRPQSDCTTCGDWGKEECETNQDCDPGYNCSPTCVALNSQSGFCKNHECWNLFQDCCHLGGAFCLAWLILCVPWYSSLCCLYDKCCSWGV